MFNTASNLSAIAFDLVSGSMKISFAVIKELVFQVNLLLSLPILSRQLKLIL